MQQLQLQRQQAAGQPTLTPPYTVSARWAGCAPRGATLAESASAPSAAALMQGAMGGRCRLGLVGGAACLWRGARAPATAGAGAAGAAAGVAVEEVRVVPVLEQLGTAASLGAAAAASSSACGWAEGQGMHLRQQQCGSSRAARAQAGPSPCESAVPRR
jgi:hypothetical protein